MSARTSNTKQYVLGGLIGLSIVGAVGGIIWALNEYINEDIDQLAEMLPAETLVLVAVKDLEDLHENFSDLMELDILADNDEVQDSLERLDKQLDLDLTDMDELRATGLNFSDAWGMAIVLEDDQDITQGGSAYLLIPLDDAEPAQTFILDRFDEAEIDLNEERIDGQDVWVMEDDESTAFMLLDDWLVFAIHMEGSRSGDGLSSLEALLNVEETMEDSTTFTEIKEELGDDWNTFFYARLDSLDDIVEGAIDASGLSRSMLEEMASVDAIFDELKSYRGVAMTMGVSREQVSIRTAVLRNDGRWEDLSGDGQDQFAQYVPGNPLFVLRSSNDSEELWKYYEEILSDSGEWEQLLYGLESGLGMDVGEKMVEMFTGNVAMTVLEGSPGLIPVTVVAWAEVRDEERTVSLLEDASDMAMYAGWEVEKQEEDAVTWFYIEDIPLFGSEMGVTATPSLGVGRDHLILTLSDGTREQLTDTLETPDESFIDELPGDLGEDFEKGPMSLTWVNVEGIVSLVDEKIDRNPFASMQKEWEVLKLALAPFQDIVARTEVNEGLMTNEILIRARQGDFIPHIEESIEDGFALEDE